MRSRRGRGRRGVVAADQVWVRAACAGESFGQELERRRVPEQCRDRAGSPAPRRRRAGRRASGASRRRRAICGQDRGRSQADDPRRREGACGPREPRSARRSRSGRIRTSAVVASIAGRWPCRNVSRSRYAAGSQDASSTLRTSSRPAGRSAPEASTSRSARVGQPSLRSVRRLAGPRPGVSSAAQGSPASSARPDSSAPTEAAASQRAQVADGVAPALVQLAGRDDEIRVGAQRGTGC